jgi:protein gp37
VGLKTGIEWTDATWNPVTGCTRVSAGCDNCYAATLANRLLRTHYTSRLPVVDTAENRADPFAVRLWPQRLAEPLKQRRSHMIFVNSMSDLFHTDVPEEYIQRVFEVMLRADWHTFQVLTKRPARAARFCRRNAELLPDGTVPGHIWIGTSVENQRVAYRVAQLAAVPAEVRFLSCEPLIGPLSLDLEHIHWVIVGGESGPVCRPMDPDWARSIRDQCRHAGVPFFFKQVGGRTPKAAGRSLDGRTWDEFPLRRRPVVV